MLTATKIKAQINAYSDRIVSFRRHLHMYPEVGFDTKETEAFIRQFLVSEGIELLESSVGVIGIIRGKNDERCTALRADIDALPLEEENEVPYRSKVKGKMHACGHDGHTAMLMGAAHVLQQNRQELCSDVILIFQPAEEGPFPGGAKLMLEELESHRLLKKISSISALHLTTEYQCGKIAVGFGPMMASTDEFDIEITGVGGHVGLPHMTSDALSVAAKFITGMESFMSKQIDPFDSTVFAVGTLNAGTARNIVPKKALISGSLRCQREETRGFVLEGAEKLLKALCDFSGTSYSINIRRGLPVLVVNNKKTEEIEGLARELIGKENVIRLKHSNMGAEDFAFLAEKIPATFVWIGARNEEKDLIHMMHSAKFDIDENALSVGASLLSTVAALPR